MGGYGRQFVALSLCGVLHGVLALGLGTAIREADTPSSTVIRCDGFAWEDPRPSTSRIRLVNPGRGWASLDLGFLDPQGTVLHTRHSRLGPGTDLTLEMLTRFAGATMEVAATGAIQVEVTLRYDDAPGGPAEHWPLLCAPLAPQ